MGYKMNKRDTAEENYIEIWRRQGLGWIPVNKECGFDGILVSPTGNHIVENKTGKKALTPLEKKRKAEIESAGGEYNIIHDETEAAKFGDWSRGLPK